MTATAAMILMRPGEGHLEACPMPALNRRFTTYTLDARPHGAEAGGGVGLAAVRPAFVLLVVAALLLAPSLRAGHA